MATPAGKPRQRAWKPKNRTGCKTCKIRKIKCDEEKPHCKRCTSTGRKCDGYDTSFRPLPTSPPSIMLETTSSQINYRYGRSPSPVYLVPALRLNSIEERESFDFFISHAVSSLRGVLDSPFWQREVLQGAHRDPAIQHCVIALGAMHRRFVQGKLSHIHEEDMSDKHLQFALRQSNSAIQDLIRKQGPSGKIARTDRVTLMTCSILFSSMFCLQGYQTDAFEHLRSGIRMLNEMDAEKQDTTENHPVDVESLRSIFVGLDMQARSIMPAAQHKNWVPKPKSKATTNLPRAELNMGSLLALSQYMESLLNHLGEFHQRTALRPSDEADEIYLEYCALRTRFLRATAILETLFNKDLSTGNVFSQPLTSLRLMQCLTEYLMRTPRSDVEARLKLAGEYNPDNDPFGEPLDPAKHFVKMFELATELLPISSTGSPVFTTTFGPVHALWLVAVRAPSTCTALRKRAVRLMLSHPRREGFWDGMVAGQIAQEALRLEQESTQEELGLSATPSRDLIVPDDLRIINVAVSFDSRKAKVEYSSSQDITACRPGAVRWFGW